MTWLTRVVQKFSPDAKEFAPSPQHHVSEIADSESELRALLASMDDVILVLDSEGRYLKIAPTNPSLLYRPSKELLGKTLHEVFPADQADFFLKKIRLALSKKAILHFEYSLIINKSTVWFHGSVSPLTETTVLLVGRDITELKLGSEALRQAEVKFRNLVEDSLAGVYIIQGGTFEYVNPRLAEMFGYTQEEIIRAKSVSDLVAESDRAKVSENIRKRLEAEITSLQYTFRGQKKDGSFIEVEVYGTRTDYNGSSAVIGTILDITERRSAEEALQLSEQKYKTIFQQAPVGIYQSTYDGRFLTVNPTLVRILGYDSAEELLSRDISRDIYYDSQQRKILIDEYNRVGSVADLELRWKRKDGTPIWIQLNSNVVADASGRFSHFEGFVRDIEGQKQVEERYRQFFDESLAGTFISTPDGKILACNEAFARIFGYVSVADVITSSADAFYSDTKARTDLMQLLKKKRRLENFEELARRRDGTLVPVIENIVGKFDEREELVEILGFVFDNSERKRLEEQLRQAQKMESIGTLAGGIAHDFNNILAIIIGHAAMFEHVASDSAARGKRIDAIIKASQRGAALVSQLLTFARKADVRLESVMINDVATEVTRLLAGTFPKTITFALRLGQNLPSIVADSTQMHQVLLNLCVNARDAMPHGGTLTISTGLVPKTAVRVKFPTVDADQYIDLEVSDNGLGMDEATKDRIFDPFFTTKEHGKGTGLGLATVFGIIASHHGFIDVESTPGAGTEFHIYLPVHHQTPHLRTSDNGSSKELPGGNETILLVEDEDLLREFATITLESRGYHVIPACDGEEAVAVFREKHGSINLIVSDIGLPKLSGSDAVMTMLEIRPGTKAILASGYIDPGVRAEMMRVGVRQFIAKPYDEAELLRRVREVIDGGNGKK
ncbi:MAG: PAS domain S-box protein [Bacteroidota bacterium]